MAFQRCHKAAVRVLLKYENEYSNTMRQIRKECGGENNECVYKNTLTINKYYVPMMNAATAAIR